MATTVPTPSYPGRVREVVLGADADAGGTRAQAVTVGGQGAMPFEGGAGELPHRPRVAMEVYDRVPERYPEALREAYREVLEDPAAWARLLVEEHGAELVGIRLESTHPDRGDTSPEAAVEVVAKVRDAVGVPLMVTGVNHAEKTNAVMRTVAEAFAGERLLLDWVETDNYKTVAAAAMAYGHSVVALSPVDVNMAKQLNILVTELGLDPGRVVMDPMMSPLGYGLDYGYTITERIRLAALAGDEMLAFPTLYHVGHECARIKELLEPEELQPELGGHAERAAWWETVTATSLLVAGADVLVLQNPRAARVIRERIQEMHGSPAERE